MVSADDIVRCPEGGVLVVGNVVLSAWTQAYNERGVAMLGAAVERAAAAHDVIGALGVYRIKGLREVPSAETRNALAAMGTKHPFKMMSTVLDSSGFANAIIRLFLSGLTQVMGAKAPMAVAGSVDEGLEQLRAAGFDADALREPLAILLGDVFGSSPK